MARAKCEEVIRVEGGRGGGENIKMGREVVCLRKKKGQNGGNFPTQ